MTGWNFRVVREDEMYYRIYEVYYHEGEISSYIDDVGVSGSSEEDLKEHLQLLMKAFEAPVLDVSELVSK